MNNWKKVFAIIWTGQFFSILTSSLVNFAIILWLTFETKSAETLAFATIAAMLPQGILGMFSGVFIDRWSRKKIMILSDSFIAFCTLILAFLFYLRACARHEIISALSDSERLPQLIINHCQQA